MNDDEEPTLETPASGEDDDPTLETEGRDDTQETSPETATQTRARKATGWGMRLEMMSSARREHRRQAINRFWIASVPVFVLLVVAVVLLAVYGGQGDEGAAVSSGDVVSRVAAEGSALLLIEDAGALASAVILHPWDTGGVVLAVPAITLLETQGMFRTLVATYEDGGAAAVKAALSRAFDVPLGPVAVVDEADLRTVLSPAGLDALPDQPSASVDEQAGSFAQAVRGLVGGYSSDVGGAAWEGLGLRSDDEAEFLKAVGADALSMAENVWTVSVLTGTVVEGDGFRYLEPDMEAARELLIVSVEEVPVSVEIRDGAGVEGAARLAGSLLEEAGFALAPMSYAEAYPGVVTTQVLASAETMEEARRVVEVLGVGEIVQDETLDPDLVIVVLGKDFEATTPTSTSESTG